VNGVAAGVASGGAGGTGGIAATGGTAGGGGGAAAIGGGTAAPGASGVSGASGGGNVITITPGANGSAGSVGASGAAGTVDGSTGFIGQSGAGIQSDAGSVLLQVLNDTGGTITGGAGTTGGAGIRSGATSLVINNSLNGRIQGGSGTTLGGSGIEITAGSATISNFGTILPGTGGMAYGIKVSGGAVTALTNSQGGNTPLTYNGLLPVNYSIVLGGTATTYGKLAVTNGSGLMTFGIDSGPVLSKQYAGVISGVTSDLISSSRTGVYGGFGWSLSLDAGSTTLWNLIFGPTVADTQESLKQSAAALRSIYNMQSSVVNNSLNYDCTVYANNGLCFSGGGRFAVTNTLTGNTTSSLLIGSYKATNNVRIGGYIDQNVPTAEITGTRMDKSPLYGLFGVWNQNPDAMGYEVRLSTGYGKQNITQTRDLIGTSEAGAETASLITQAVSGVVSYALPLVNSSWIASPYAGLRKTKIKRLGYTETQSSAVFAPLTYSDLSQGITTALLGVRLSKKYGEDLYITGNLGVEQYVSSKTSNLIATGVEGLTATDFSSNGAKTRPTASFGVSYAVAKGQQLSFSVIYRKEAFQTSGSKLGMLMYQVGL
jgi:hypothetical protein